MNMFTDSEITNIKTPSSVRARENTEVHRRIRRNTRHMIPIDLLIQEFNIAVDHEIMYKRLEHMLKDCNIDEITISGVTALTQSALDGRLESVKFLVELGADVNKKDGLGWTPLHYAVSEGYESICKYLLQNGADSTIKNKQGQFPIELAEDDNIVSLLLDTALYQ